MGFLNLLFGKRAKKLGEWSQASDPPAWITRPETGAGVAVDAENAEEIAAVYNAVTLIASAVGKMPLIKYKKLEGGGKVRDGSHPVYKLFQRRPNGFMYPSEFKERIVCDLILRGNFYAQKVVTARAEYELIPMNPDRVTVEYNPSRAIVRYLYEPEGGGLKIFSQAEILHIKGERSDGIVGRSVIDNASGGLSRLYAMNDSASEFFGNASIPYGILEHPDALSDQAQERLRKKYEEYHRGAGKRHRIFVAEEGMVYKQLSIKNNDAQFLESRKFEIEEIARWFNLPPHKLKHLEKASFNNIEHQGLEYYQDGIHPWTTRIQEAINFSFFSDYEDDFCEFLFDSLLITDTKTRYEAHNLAVMGGWKSGNEVRELENLNPVDGLEKPRAPLNMEPVDQDPDESKDGADDDPESKTVEVVPEEVRKGLEMVLLEPIVAALKRQRRALERLSKKEKFTKDLEKFWIKERETFARALYVPSDAYFRLSHEFGAKELQGCARGAVDAFCQRRESRLIDELRDFDAARFARVIESWDSETQFGDSFEEITNFMEQQLGDQHEIRD